MNAVRRVVEHKAVSKDKEELMVITVFEEGVTREQIKKLNRFTKRHQVLVNHGGKYDFK